MPRTEEKKKSNSEKKASHYVPHYKKKKYTKGKRLSPYKVRKVTHKNVDTLDLKPADKTYLNYPIRDLDSYISSFKGLKFDNDLETLLIAKLVFAKIMPNEVFDVLDCGAGMGRMLKDLISWFHPEKIKCTGISMHYFKETGKSLKKFKDSLDWYCDKAEDVLPTLKSESYDLITDLWGAYFYSENRIDLLYHYHRLLKPNGTAFIHLSSCTQNQLQTGKKTSENLEDHLAEQYPETFMFGKKNKHFFVIHKKTMRSPLLSFKTTMIQEACWKRRDMSDTKALREGQAFFPSKLTIKKEPSYSLRSIPYTRSKL